MYFYFQDTAEKEGYFPKQWKEAWVIHFCFGQAGTPSLSQPPPLDPMDYDKQYNSPEISWRLEIMTKNTTCLTNGDHILKVQAL